MELGCNPFTARVRENSRRYGIFCCCMCWHFAQADPYIKIKIGKEEMDCADEYVPNSIEPYFGRLVICDRNDFMILSL